MRHRRPVARRPAVAVRILSGALAVALVTLVAAGCAAFQPAEPEALTRADAHFERGEYEAAVSAYEEHLKAAPEAAEVDRVLFRLALLRALPGHAATDPAAARAHLRQLVAAFPASAWAGPARYLLQLDLEVHELRRQLDELKRIDLEERSG